MTDQPAELDCHAASRLISDALEGAVGPEEDDRLRRHFVVCESCRNVSGQMDFLRRAVRRMGSESPQ